MTHLLQAIATRIAPLFLTPATTQEAARDAAIQAINAYNPKSLAEAVCAARILALSLAAIAAAAQAEAPNLSPTQRLAYLAKANTLSRSAARAETSLAQDRRHPPAQPQSAPAVKAAAPQPTLPDAALTALVDQAMDEFRSITTPRPARANPGFRQRLLQAAPMRIPA